MSELIDQFLQLLQTFIANNAPLPEPADDTLNLFVFFVQWSAIILSVLAGLYAARKHGMDFYGSLVIAFVVSLGGGTIRDMLLGRFPIFWLADTVYPVSVVVIAFSSMFIGGEAKRSKTVATKIAQPVERIADDQSGIFVVIDALALGLWAYLGTIYALDMGISPIVAPILGVITASFGGVLRDVFFARVPQSFMPGQLYAAAAAVGAITYSFLWWLGFGGTVGFLACFALTFVIRIVSVRFNIQSH